MLLVSFVHSWSVIRNSSFVYFRVLRDQELPADEDPERVEATTAIT
jgi:hypothetical protein